MKAIKYRNESDSGQNESLGAKMGRSVGHALESDPRRQLTQIAEAQGAPVIRKVADLAVDFWPEDESADDVSSYIYRQQHQDRATTPEANDGINSRPH